MSEAEQDEYRALNIDRDDLDAIEAGLEQIDRFNRVAELPPTPRLAVVWTAPQAPDEGGPVDEADVKALHIRFDRLPDLAKLWTGKLVAEGKHSFDWRIKETPTQRRFELYRGVLALAEAGENWGNDDVINDIVYRITAQKADTTGATLGLLDAHQATAFAQKVRHYLTPTSVA